jgi:acetolactate synthase-1/2/3 large subunit
MLGNNGKPYANRAVANADLLIIVGARIADRAVPRPQNLERSLRVIHIDIDSAEIGKNLGPTIPLVGDAKLIFEELCAADVHIDTAGWIAKLEEIKTSTVDHRTWSDRLVNPMKLVQDLSEKMDDDAVYIADVGQNQLWSADNYVMKHGRYLTSGGMGCMGYAIPAAIGARLAAPDKQVVAVMGDGGFQMSMCELALLAQEGVSVKLVVLNNRMLGMVREYQHYACSDRYTMVELTAQPELYHLAAAYGLPYLRLQKREEMDSVLADFLSRPGSALLECVIDPLDLVAMPYPAQKGGEQA